MSLESFYIGAALFFAFIVAFLIYSPARRSMRLNMKADQKSPAQAKVLPGRQPSQPTGSRNLSVLFNYNGHTWEAFEVLGCPAGSSYDAAKAAFALVKRQADAESIAFFETALEAIRSSEAARQSAGQ